MIPFTSSAGMAAGRENSNYKFNMSASRRRSTWDAKRNTNALKDSIAERIASKRRVLLKRLRSEASLSEGLKRYRQSLGLSRTNFAEEFGITRRALFNYENGLRAISGELLEKIVRRGDAELSDVFGLSVEPAPAHARLEDAKLAIDLFQACRSECPGADAEDIKALVAAETANWPMTQKRTAKAVRVVARRLSSELSDYYGQQLELEDQIDPKT